MFNLLFKRLPIFLPNWGNPLSICDSGSSHRLLVLNTQYLIKSFSNKSEKSEGNSLVVSFLINSCGLSPEYAISASKKINFRTPDKPISVLNFLRNNGFTNTHISKLIKTFPRVLLSDTQKTLLPKLEFFQSIGVATDDLANFISSNPAILSRSLENQLIPCYNFLKSVILLGDKKIVCSLKRLSWFFHEDLEKNVVPKIEALRNLGVPASSLSSLVTGYPSVLLRKREKFDRYVNEVLEMGFNPASPKFVHAVQSKCGMSESNWEHKREVYKKNGWSEDEILMAFRRQPTSMNLSEGKITKVMDFLVNKMGWNASAIAKFPIVLLYSLEKRTIPRYLVIKALASKGLVKEDKCFSSVLCYSEKYFLDRFIIRYRKDFPELLNVFEGKVSRSKLRFESAATSGTEQC